MATSTSNTFCINDYDCIGFDMDHTFVQYHLPDVFKVMLYLFHLKRRNSKCISYLIICDYVHVIMCSLKFSINEIWIFETI